MTVEDDINRLRDLLAQLPPDRQRTIVPRLIRAVMWFSELETDERGEGGSTGYQSALASRQAVKGCPSAAASTTGTT
jgi:hypothetical protein